MHSSTCLWQVGILRYKFGARTFPKKSGQIPQAPSRNWTSFVKACPIRFIRKRTGPGTLANELNTVYYDEETWLARHGGSYA